MNIAETLTPLLRILPAEAAHSLTIAGLKTGLGLPKIDPAQWGTGTHLPKSGLVFPNAIGLAAGFDKNAEVCRAMSRLGFGFLECGTVTPRAQPGNPKPRLFRAPKQRAIINRLGFNNKGADIALSNIAAQKAHLTCPVGINIGANKTSPDFISDYEYGLSAAAGLADYITVNVSSPNTPGLRDLQYQDALIDLLNRCETAWRESASPTPVFLKLSPDLADEDVDLLIDVLRTHGQWLCGLIISNTTIARPDYLPATLQTEPGGLSGQPLLAASTALLRTLRTALGDCFDLIGCGGVASGADAYAKIKAGAHAVQLYTALTYQGPGAIAAINRQLRDCLAADGYKSVSDAVAADV